MKKTTIIILAVIAIVAIYLIGTYNSFVGMKQNVDSKWAQVENQLQRRFDLVLNLVETVKGLTKQEQAVFGEIANARSKYAGAQTQTDKVNAANQFESSLGRLLVITENYPTLQSSQLFANLMVQLEGTENRISAERKNYNDTVQSYNTSLARFPGGIIAKMFGFTPAEYFKVSEEAKANPQVKF